MLQINFNVIYIFRIKLLFLAATSQKLCDVNCYENISITKIMAN